MIADALGKSDEVTVENAPELLKKYVDDFDKLDHSKKVSVLWKIESKLTTEISIEVKMEAAKKKGAQAQSRSDNSISFDAGTQILSFSDDFITGLDNAMHSDPNLIGANVYIPSYTFQGYTTWGEPYPFFTQEVNDEVLKISTSSLNYMRAEMPSLVYMGDTNTFYGIMPFMLQEDSGSSFVADLQDMFSDSWDLDMTSYLTMQITPDIDFFADTNSFTEDSRPDIGFTNSIGMRVSEPSSILLVLMGFSGIALFPKWRIEFKS